MFTRRCGHWTVSNLPVDGPTPRHICASLIRLSEEEEEEKGNEEEKMKLEEVWGELGGKK